MIPRPLYGEIPIQKTASGVVGRADPGEVAAHAGNGVGREPRCLAICVHTYIHTSLSMRQVGIKRPLPNVENGYIVTSVKGMLPFLSSRLNIRPIVSDA